MPAKSLNQPGPINSVANRLLKLELQLNAYQKLHEDELAELWKTLNDCKQKIAAISDEGESDLHSLEMQNGQTEPEEEE